MALLCNYDTAVTLDFIFERLCQPFKGKSIKKHSYTKNMGVNSRSFFVTAVSIGDFIVDFLREFEAIFKKA
jgi:hypothetical protein